MENSIIDDLNLEEFDRVILNKIDVGENKASDKHQAVEESKNK